MTEATRLKESYDIAQNHRWALEDLRAHNEGYASGSTPLIDHGPSVHKPLACAYENTRWLFLVPVTLETPSQSRTRVEKAKELCGKCGIRDVCLEQAITSPPRDNKRRILGGMTYTERQALLQAGKDSSIANRG